jgi:hypothetical protein
MLGSHRYGEQIEFIKIPRYNKPVVGDWPSGKAPGSGPGIGGSNPSSPAK